METILIRSGALVTYFQRVVALLLNRRDVVAQRTQRLLLCELFRDHGAVVGFQHLKIGSESRQAHAGEDTFLWIAANLVGEFRRGWKNDLRKQLVLQRIVEIHLFRDVGQNRGGLPHVVRNAVEERQS